MRYEFILQTPTQPYAFEAIEAQLCAQGALPQADGSWLWPLAPPVDCSIRRVVEGERGFHAVGLSMDNQPEKALQAFAALAHFAQSQGLQLIDAQQLKEVTDKDEAAFLAQYGRLLAYADGCGEVVFAHQPTLSWSTAASAAPAPAKGLFASPMAKVFLGLLIVSAFVFYKLAQKFLALPL